MPSVLKELTWRGMLQDATEGAASHLGEGSRTCYIGFDPSATSLHVGSLLPVMGLVHLQRAGHHPIAVVGGGTGLIGDPSGKTTERQLLRADEAFANAESIRGQLEHFLDFEVRTNPARMRNNYDWLGQLRMVDFLRDTGKHFSVNAMLRKESVRRRLDEEEAGISFTEFSYLLLQAYDFLELYRREGCTVQLGGSDQWGNITGGVDLIRRVLGGQAYGVTLPLVTTAQGVKFGKTEAGAVWLDARLTSPFRFYQFWLNTDDKDVARYLRFFTLLEEEGIAALELECERRPDMREAQRALAEEVTTRVHGSEGLQRARLATEALFGGDLEGFSAEEIEDVFAEVPSSEFARDELSGEGKALVDLLAEVGLNSSKGDARRAILGGGIYLNGRRAADTDVRVGLSDLLGGRFLVLRKGKKNHHLLRVSG